jgi:hypothetical protein
MSAWRDPRADDSVASSRNAALRKGMWMVIGGLLLAVCSYLPLQLSIWFGPKDANPIGFGILYALGIPVGLLIAGSGVLYFIVTLILAQK